jgi:hypothetical protein
MYCQRRHKGKIIINDKLLVIIKERIHNHSKILPAMTVLMHSYRRDMADVLQTDRSY